MSLVAGTPLADVYSYWPDTNQLDSVLLSTGVERRFTYDGAGNVIATNRGALAHSYTYDAANRMSSFAVNGVVQAQYQYNSLGQQVVRHLTASGKTIHSVHDALGNRIAEYDYDAGTGTSTLIREYIWANAMIVGVVENGTLYYVRTDHIGRPVFATDDAGVKVREATYVPFGGVYTSTGPNPNLRFTASKMDLSECSIFPPINENTPSKSWSPRLLHKKSAPKSDEKTTIFGQY